MTEIDDHIRRIDQAYEGSPLGFSCTVATTAIAESDEVLVTIDTDDEPKERQEVEWRPRVNGLGAVVFPERDMPGLLIFSDIGLPWLMW